MLRDSSILILAYLIDVQESSEEAIVLPSQLIHLLVACVDVTLRACNFLLVVKVAGTVVNKVSSRGEMLPQISMVLIGEQTCAVAWLNVSPQHLHLLCRHLDRALRIGQERGAQRA